MDRIETPFLIDVSIPSFEHYINSLAKTGKKNYKYTDKNNKDLTYSIIEYDKDIVKFFMELWEEQLIDGQIGGVKGKKWGAPYCPDYITYLNQKGIINLFAAYNSDSTILALHFVEKYDQHVYCHPPLYKKDILDKRYIAKYMWFNLIKYYIEHSNIHWVDLGGGYRGTWKDLVINRKNYMKKMAYKWLYIPKYVKENPKKELDYVVEINQKGRKLKLNGAVK
tara:strand:- start:7514 stop:8182 length:669 start_codon:yes stop_codon:yes gene_type:complete